MRKVFYITILSLIFCGITLADFARDVELARRYVALNKYEDARKILEPNLLTHPDDPTLKILLKQVYRALKDNAALLSLIEDDLLRNPNDAHTWMEAGDLHLSLGNLTEAKKAFDTATKLSPKDEGLTLSIFNSYRTWGFTDEGIALLTGARKESDNPAAYAMEIASMYEIRGDWNSAADEYAIYLKQYPDRFGDVEQRLNEVAVDKSQLAELERAVES